MSSIKIILVVLIVAILVGTFILLNHSKISIPKTRSNLESLEYASTKDLWWTNTGNKNLIIFLHGMYAQPENFEEIGPLLTNDNWNVYAPALPASSYTVEDLRRIGPWTWDESVQIAQSKIMNATNGYEKIVLAGHSQGGSLALYLASQIKNLNGLIIVSAPTSLYSRGLGWLNNIGIYLSGILQYIKPNGIHSYVNNYEEKSKLQKMYDDEYLNYPTTIYSFKHGLKDVRENLKNINVPTLLIYHNDDRTVNIEDSKIIKNTISAPTIKSIVFTSSDGTEPYTSKHKLFNYEYTKNKVNYEIIEFLNTIASNN